MKTSMGSDLICRRRGNESSRPVLPTSGPTAFTVIELLVVIATVAVLAAMLLPALAGTWSQSKVTACTARFREWAASANLYANDNRGWLPAFSPTGGGGFAWDVGTGMLNALYPYGMDVPDWFCPMRPAQLDAANQWARANLGRSIQNGTDLRLYFSKNYPQECVLNDNYWVPRYSNIVPMGPMFPIDYSGRPQTVWPVWLRQGMPTSAIYGWPQRLHDIAAPYVPLVSDSAASGQVGGLNSPHPASTSVTNIAPITAHFINGTLLGVNLAFADGHVEGHSPSQMRVGYYDSANYWFY
ncbi:MAG TPA: hypothetical protein VKU37_11875 [Verrucomicrobiae bacterium]|nr:hypothetical protein [Verrucomicrobiae bacterium]